MRAMVLIVLLTGLSPLALFAGTPSPEVVERGPHSRTWQGVREIETDEGTIPVTNRFEELQTGLHRWDNGWVVTDPKVELFQDGAVIRNLQYSVIFSPNLASLNAVDILLPDGQSRVAGQILGLAYADANNSVLIAEIQDCSAEVGGPEQNEVTYRNAFSDYAIDVRFVARRHAFAQELILRERLRSPVEYGLSEHAVLMLLSEFTTFPQLTKETRVWQQAQGDRPAITDERITFGSVEFGAGKAFTIGARKSYAVAKSFELIEGRWFVLEKIPWQHIQGELQQLEARNQPLKKREVMHVANRIPLPAPRKGRTSINPIQMARADLPPERGFVADWDLLITTTNKTFFRDKQYYVAGEVILSGETRFEQTVIKFSPTNSARLNITGTVVAESSDYAPITLTHRDDHSIGESIGSATLNGYATNSTGLKLGDSADGNTLKHLRFFYLDKAVEFDTGGGAGELNLAHVQFVKCRYPLRAVQSVCVSSCGAAINLNNALAYDCATFFQGDYGILRAQQLTLHQCGTLGSDDGNDCEISITNAILATTTNWGNIPTNLFATVKLDSDEGVFQTVGGGSHYLSASSEYRNQGSNVTAALAADLNSRTTYPPKVLSNNTTTDTVLNPQAQRDTDTPDLGFSYGVLDFVFNNVILTNATLLLTNGVVVGTYGSSASYGILIKSGGKLFSEGSASALVHVARYNNVQEQATTNWSASSVGPAVYVNSTAGSPEGRFRFTSWSIPGGSGDHLHAAVGGFGSISTPFGFTHCQFGGGGIYIERAPTAITNCVFERVALDLDDANKEPARYLFNNLFRGGSLNLYPNDYETWLVKDNFFDQTALNGDPNLETSHGYNGYVTNSSRLTPDGAGDVVLTNAPIYLTSTLGRFYYPTNDGMLSLLLGTGSRFATNAGLAHFTVTTNQVKDTGWVDIGAHFVAVTNDLPIDTDNDGVADYLENRRGDGGVNSGETDWNNATDLGLKVLITRPRNGANLP